MPNNRGIKTPPLSSRPPPKISRLGVVECLKANLTQLEIAKKYGVTQSGVGYHVGILKEQGVIRMVGYSTWEILKPLESEKKTTAGSRYVGFPKPPPSRGNPAVVPAVLTQSTLTPHQQDAVRTHAISTTWQVPRGLRNWNNTKRTQYLTAHDIPHIQLGIAGGGQRIIVKNRKIQLLDKVIIIYDKASYFAATAREGKGTALAKHLSIIKHIERLLHVEFLIGDDHKFRVSRQHHALIHNALAKQYNETGKKLEVRNGRGLWLLIDNSKDENGNGMNELEAVRSDKDAKKVKDWFNGLYDIPADPYAPAYTPATVLEMIAGVTANQAAFAENMTSHVEAVQNISTTAKDLGAGVQANTRTISDLGKAMQDMNDLMKQLQERQSYEPTQNQKDDPISRRRIL